MGGSSQSELFNHFSPWISSFKGDPGRGNPIANYLSPGHSVLESDVMDSPKVMSPGERWSYFVIVFDQLNWVARKFGILSRYSAL